MTTIESHLPATARTLRQRVASSAPARRWFGLDALLTGACGVGYLALADAIDGLLGIGPALLRTIGGGLAVFATLVALHARRPSSPILGWTVVTVNAAWVIGSLVVAAAGPGDITAAGRGWIAAQAAVIAALATMQVRAVRTR